MLRGLLALFLSFALYAALQTIRHGGGPVQTSALEPDEQPVRPAPAPAVTRADPTAEPAVSALAHPAPPQSERIQSPKDDRVSAANDAPSPQHTTVQVLDAGAGPRRTSQAADRLTELGYRVVAINEAARSYAATTVFYSHGREPAARALRGRDHRFVAIGPNPNLSEKVDLHVLVGTDWKS